MQHNLIAKKGTNFLVPSLRRLYKALLDSNKHFFPIEQIDRNPDCDSC